MKWKGAQRVVALKKTTNVAAVTKVTTVIKAEMDTEIKTCTNISATVVNTVQYTDQTLSSS